MKKLFLIAAAILAVVLPVTAKDKKMEKELDRLLAKMTLEQKIGQMIQLEITQIAHYEYDFRDLIKAGPEKVDGLIRRFCLEERYNAEKMFKDLNPSDFATIYPFYILMLDLSAKEGFTVDQQKMETVFGQHHVGSILNMLGGNEAASLDLWQRCIADIEAASLKYNGLPLIYGIDHVHGPIYVAGGTLYPQQINLAATFNPAMVKELAEIDAYETRAAGIRWNFGPNMDLGVRPSWSRLYETWGEDPYLITVMAGAYMQGLQGPDPDHLDPYHVAACPKHYMGYSAPDNGIDRTPATITEADLREKHFAPFRQAALDGALSVMTNSSVVNGVPGVCNRQLITDWLKEELQWDGMVVTDWADVQELHRLFKMVPSIKDGLGLAVNAGIDMIMVPSSLEYGPWLKELVEEGVVPMSRIDDAVRRILRMKYRTGLFDKKPPKADYSRFGSPEFARKAYEAAVESEVLLKNEDGLLPLNPDARILVTGPAAATMRAISGGWTYSHQGSKVEQLSDPYNTLLEALQARFPNTVYEPGVEFDLQATEWWLEKEPAIDKAVAAAANVDVIICCVGENSYAETVGSIKDLNLSENQKALVKALSATGKPVVLVLAEGRPRIIHDIVPCAQAIVDVMLPSNYGGDALAALLAGDENFSARLPFTYPAFPNGFSTYNFKVMEDRSTTPGIYNYSNSNVVEWWFGSGLSYTSFAYSNLTVNKADFAAGDTLVFSVDVTNTGARFGKEAVLLYTSDEVASLMPDNRRLRAFEKIGLEPGETRTVTLSVPAKDLAFVGFDGRWHLEKGLFTVLVGGEYLKINCTETVIF
ncbi:MAG: glycoside hydrolase family 3 C-terminal domain-containing protein [Bacteroidales bacterium]|nr:glycoside hydrolase family 3 C-terminal domain-containing protein [Bacteroidales bacterium]